MTTTHSDDLPPRASGISPEPVDQLDMDGLSRILFGHAAFQCLNAACELELYELLSNSPGLTRTEIAAALGLAIRATDILLLGNTALRTLRVHDGRYSLTPLIRSLVGTPDWRRFKDTVAFEHHIVYPGQLDFTEALRTNTNVGIRRIPGNGADLYHRLGENPHLETVFYRYMHSWSTLANEQLARLDWSRTTRVLDCGGGDAVNAIVLARAHPHLKVTLLEIPKVAALAQRRISEAGLDDQISIHASDIHTRPFPTGCDAILFAHQLVIWSLEENTRLLRKAYHALPPNGKVVIFNSMSNDEGDGPLVAALDSIYFASIPAAGGMIYPWSAHEECLRQAGFTQCERIPFTGWTPHGAIIAIRP